jgi:hypothetical protein
VTACAYLLMCAFLVVGMRRFYGWSHAPVPLGSTNWLTDY